MYELWFSTVVRCDLPVVGPDHTQSLTPEQTAREYVYNDTLTYTCEQGYEPLYNHSTVKCQWDKQWQPWNITCKSRLLKLFQLDMLK